MKIKRVEFHQAVQFDNKTDQGFSVGEKKGKGLPDSIDSDYEKQIIIVKNSGSKTVVPLANVKYMVPAEKKKPATKDEPNAIDAADKIKELREAPAAIEAAGSKDPLTAPPKP